MEDSIAPWQPPPGGGARREIEGALDKDEAAEWIDESTTMRWNRAHLIGACCLCAGWLFLGFFSDRHERVAIAGWMRGWGWGSAVMGFWLMLGGIVMYSTYPDTNVGLAILLLVFGCVFMVVAPHILYNGDRRFRSFLEEEHGAMLDFPVGTRVVVVDNGTNPEIGPVAGALATVVGYNRGKLGIKFDDRQNNFNLRLVALRLPKPLEVFGADAFVNSSDIALLPPQQLAANPQMDTPPGATKQRQLPPVQLPMEP